MELTITQNAALFAVQYRPVKHARALKNDRTGFRKRTANQNGTMSRWNKGEHMP
jgi:hypothetical protein